MPGIEQQPVGMQMSGGPRAPMDWRRVLLGWGFLTLIAAVFVGAATKGGGTTKVIGAVGLLMILMSTVTLIASWLRTKTSNGGKNANASAGSRLRSSWAPGTFCFEIRGRARVRTKPVKDPLPAWARDLHICQEKCGPHHTFRR